MINIDLWFKKVFIQNFKKDTFCFGFDGRANQNKMRKNSYRTLDVWIKKLGWNLKYV